MVFAQACAPRAFQGAILEAGRPCMRTLLYRLIGCAAVLFGTLASAEASRVALVIGNSAYRNADRLANPVNDATKLGDVLKRLRFDKVTVLKDLGKDAMSVALQRFEGDATGAEIALIYFAGHGIEVDGQNYLIPVDARLATATAAEFEAIELTKVMKRLEGASKLRLVILDACRNNPFRSTMATGGRRSIGRGLARVDPGNNELVAYAAAHGTEADDGDGSHSPFMAALLKHIETPGLEIAQLFREVRDDVLVATNRGQTPQLYGSLGREQIFLKPAVVADAKAGTPEYDRLVKRFDELEQRILRQRAADAAPAAASAAPAPSAAPQPPPPAPKASDNRQVSREQAEQQLDARARAEEARRMAEEARRQADLAALRAGRLDATSPPAKREGEGQAPAAAAELAAQ